MITKWKCWQKHFCKIADKTALTAVLVFIPFHIAEFLRRRIMKTGVSDVLFFVVLFLILFYFRKKRFSD